MFQIYYENTLIFDPRGANCAEPGDQTYAMVGGQLQLAVGSAGRLTLMLAAGHPAISSMTPRIGAVKVTEQIGSSTRTIFLGRIIRDTLHFDNSHTFECEGRLACLNDTMMLPYHLPDDYAGNAGYQAAVLNNTVPAWWLGQLLSIHNGMAVDNRNKIQPGTVTVSGGAMDRSSDDFRNMWQTIQGDLPDSALGGYLNVRYVGDTAYLDYLAELTDETPQRAAFGQNLIDLTRSASAESYFNTVIPLGKDGLTCSAAPNGYVDADHTFFKSGPYVLNSPETNNGYGCVFRTVSWPEVETAAELVTRAVAYLEAAKFVASVDVSAADLSLIDSGVTPFRLGQLLTIDDPPQGIRETYAVMALDIDLTGDVETKLTLGSRGVSLTNA